ncbi:hypothetical protein POTOM_028793 [Populus tomentosa]|uniref:Uncharacterized protein n=1 Tax=Populus tomentosa TaxID=118781 RepID=A0A8X7ZJV0_POPTO|nr:hypothetical protein POTOM_028793 [Populus tomentosa]
MGAISYERESWFSSRNLVGVEENQENDQTHNVDFLADDVLCQETEQVWQSMHQNNTFTKGINKGSLQKIQRKKSQVLLEGYVEGSSSSSEDELKRTKSLTDDDLDELKGCLDLGFGFSYDEIPELCNTLPALELCYSMSQKFLDEHQKSPERSSPAVAEAANSSPIANWKISSPGDHPEDVKARLKYWAQAVAFEEEEEEEKCFSGESLSIRAFTKYFQTSVIAEINFAILAGVVEEARMRWGDKEVKKNKLTHVLNSIVFANTVFL